MVVEQGDMDVSWTDLAADLRSGDSDRVNDAIDRLEAIDRDDRLRQFDAGFETLASVYRESDDGYVRQAAVRAVDTVSPGLAVFVMLGNEEGTDATAGDLERRLDTAAGFFLKAIQDDDGRVRNVAKRAFRGVFRGYEVLDASETVAALATELEKLAEEYEGKRRKHLLEAREDAAYVRGPAGTSIAEAVWRTAGHQEEQ